MKVFLALLTLLLAGCGNIFRQPSYAAIQQEYSDVVVRPNSRPAPTSNPQQLDLQQCMLRALQRNPDYRIALARIDKARGALIAARSQLLPTLQLGWRYLHADSPALNFASKLDQRKFQLQGDLNYPGDFGSSNLSLDANWRFNLAGRELLQSKIAGLGVKISKLEEQAIKNNLIDAVIISYYDALAARHFIDIARRSAATVESQLKETQVLYQGGSSLKSDVLALKVRFASSQENVVKAGNRYRLALNALAILMGEGPEQEWQLSEADWQPVQLPENFEKGLAVALSKRPELKQARQRLIAARYQVDVAHSGYVPDVELFGSYYFEDRDLKYSSNRDNWKVGVAVVWKIFDGLRTHSQVVQAKALVREMLLQDRKTTLTIEHQVSAAYRNWQEAKQRVAVLQLALSEAEENLGLVKNQFQGGAATITKYLDSELALTNTRFLLTTARYDLKKARASVGKALGYCGTCAQNLIEEQAK